MRIFTEKEKKLFEKEAQSYLDLCPKRWVWGEAGFPGIDKNWYLEDVKENIMTLLNKDFGFNLREENGRRERSKA